MLRVLVILLLILSSSLSCKPRRSNSGIASGPPCEEVAQEGCSLPGLAEEFMAKMGKIEFISEASRQYGIYKSDHPAIVDLYNFAARDNNRRIQIRAAAVLAEVMYRGNMQAIAVGGNHYRARDIFATLYLRNSRFRVCQNPVDCGRFLQEVTAFFKLPDDDLNFEQLFNSVRADLKSMPQSTSTKIVEFRVAAAHIWQRFYKVTGFESLTEQGKTPGGESGAVASLRADARNLMATTRRAYRVHNDPSKIKQAVVRDLLVGEYLAPVLAQRPDLLEAGVTVDKAAMGIDPMRHLTKEEEALITEGIDSVVASLANTIDSLEVLTIYLDRLNKSDPDQLTAWLQSLRQGVTLWYKSYRPNEVVNYPDNAISPVIASLVLSRFMQQEILLPFRDQWVKTFEDMARSIPSEMKDPMTLNMVLTEGRNLLNTVNTTLSERLGKELGFNAARMLAKEKYLARQTGFHSWWFQIDRFIVASMQVGAAYGALEKATASGDVSKAKRTDLENALKAASDSMAAHWLRYACYDYRFGQQGSASVTLPEGFGPNTTTSPNWCAGWFSGYRRIVGVNHILGDGFDAPGADGRLKLDNICRYPDESHPNSYALEARLHTYVSKLRVKEICDATAMEATATSMLLMLNPTGMLTHMFIGRLVAAGAQLAVNSSIRMGANVVMQSVVRASSHYTLNVVMGAAVFGWLNKTWYSLAGLQPWWDTKKSWLANAFGQEYLWGLAFFAGMPPLQRLSSALATKINSGLYGSAGASLASRSLIRAPIGMRVIDFGVPVAAETAVFVPLPFVEHWIMSHFGEHTPDPTVQQLKFEIGEIKTEVLRSLMMVLSFRVGHGANAVRQDVPTYRDYRANPLRSLRRISETRFGEGEVDAYMVLGISRHANVAQIQRAYEMTTSSMSEAVAQNPAKAQQIQAHMELVEISYRTLRDSATRARHDRAWDQAFASGAYTYRD